MKNIYACTETNSVTSPSFVSLNNEEGTYKLSVRSTGEQNVSVAEMSVLELSRLHYAIALALGIKPSDENPHA